MAYYNYHYTSINKEKKMIYVYYNIIYLPFQYKYKV